MDLNHWDDHQSHEGHNQLPDIAELDELYDPELEGLGGDEEDDIMTEAPPAGIEDLVPDVSPAHFSPLDLADQPHNSDSSDSINGQASGT